MYNIILDKTSSDFLFEIEKTEGLVELTTSDYGWDNFRYKSDLFRMAHVERYYDEKINVLHVTTFPHFWSPEPIFGFDVIMTNDVPIGAYMDLSPIVHERQYNEKIDWIETKPKPEWATVFSKNFILIKPNSMEELQKFCDYGLSIYKWYIKDVLSQKNTDNIETIIQKQNTYCDIQSSNPRTYNVLKSKLGETTAKYFMENILFPKIIRY